jgi:predicted O-linked N-acetylglucosamine transferase (SPINDLY family)
MCFRLSSLELYSTGPDDKSDIRQRLINSFDKFAACEDRSDAEIARAIADGEIDILVDLKGFTKGARTNVLAHRPAPIQVNYLGYPGTMGAPYIDYIIGDHTILSDTDRAAYSEKLVKLPHSYQPNDRKRLIADQWFRRDDFGLPAGRLVFCCFNNNHKILPDMFDRWMRILKAVEGGTLWLLAENPAAIENLKKEAAVRGVDPARLVFAERVDPPEHLARHRLADLFLDTLPYNAHTTASDALWAGLPVLTQIGESFAGRVAASLLRAIGLPELVAQTADQYERLAVELASDPAKLAAIKATLESNRLTTPLFDTQLFTGHIEAAYQAMYDRYQAGLPPDHVVVPA